MKRPKTPPPTPPPVRHEDDYGLEPPLAWLLLIFLVLVALVALL